MKLEISSTAIATKSYIFWPIIVQYNINDQNKSSIITVFGIPLYYIVKGKRYWFL